MFILKIHQKKGWQTDRKTDRLDEREREREREREKERERERSLTCFICTILLRINGKEIKNTTCSSSFNYGNCNVQIPLHIVKMSELIVYF